MWWWSQPPPRATRLTDQLEGVVVETPLEPEEIIDEKVEKLSTVKAPENEKLVLPMIILTSFVSGLLVGILLF